MKKFKPGDRVMVRERFSDNFYETEVIADVNYDGRAKNKYLVAGVDFDEQRSLPARTVSGHCLWPIPK